MSARREPACPCGCTPDTRDECPINLPVPKIKGCGGCESLDSTEIAYCSRQGWFCGPNSCALKSMIGGAA